MYTRINHYLYFLIFILLSCNKDVAYSELSYSGDIRINQIGFRPGAPKTAVVLGNAEVFHLVDVSSQKVAFTGRFLDHTTTHEKQALIADFSEFTETGQYVIHVPGVGYSPEFTIDHVVFEELGTASLKAFYYNRASIELEEQYAGAWARPLGHPDDRVLVHASAASKERPEGTVLSVPKGWYDAGDYNKYIVNSGITMGTLLSLYEDFPSHSSSLNLNLPESGNGIPDLLNEALWNLEWMIKMQDPHDGGVYHKLTAAKFEGTLLPHEAQSTRYVVAKSTAAALNFAAVMAQASRVYGDFLPDMAIECLKAAQMAWVWAKSNPETYYEQADLNKKFHPSIETGAYGNRMLGDEWLWAASELYISTHNKEYLDFIPHPESFELPNWGNVGWLGYYSLLRYREDLHLPQGLLAQIKHQLLQKVEEYATAAKDSDYRVVMGYRETDFVWGSNSVAANQGIALLQAYILTGDGKFTSLAQANLDYLLGRNATGYCYVTGFGQQSPQDPHHRASAAAPDTPPVPGFIVGGPNPGQQDGCNYRSKIPSESYVDDYCSYASNEVAINWNAPFAYLINGLEAILKQK